MKVDLGEEEGIEVQMAPLIDCVFLLLIFFLVATTLKKIDDELPLSLPDAKATIEVQQPNNFSSIGIDASGAFYLDGTPVSTSILHSSLRSMGQSNPDIKLRLDVDRNAPFQSAMEVLDLLRFEELKNVSINTSKDGSSRGK